MKIIKLNYKPSGFATLGYQQVVAVRDGMESYIDAGGQAPGIGCAIRCGHENGMPIVGHVVAVDAHCNGRVTVTCEIQGWYCGE